MGPVDVHRRGAAPDARALTDRAPRGIGFAFGVAAALAILLTGPLLLFNPWLVSAEQARHDVPATLGVDQGAVDRVTAPMLLDLFRDGDFAESLDGRSPPILDVSERSHMRDVGGLVRVLALLEVVALVTLVLTGRRLRGERARRGRLVLTAAAGIGAAALVLGVFFAVAFDTAFAAFHALFFKAGTWQFGPDSNLIRLFPEPFWFEVSLLAGVSIVLAAGVAAWLARRHLASAEAGH
jgi:integral membrane protein (TIGR01906 family)